MMDTVQIIQSIFGVDLPIKGGSGKFKYDPIVLQVTDKNNYVQLEYEVMDYLLVARMVQWEVVSQTLHFKGDRKIDQITIAVKDPFDDEITFEDYFFDVTECFDRFSVKTGEYMNDIGK